MDPELLKLAAQLGPVSAVIIMWWLERKDRTQAQADAKYMTVVAADAAEIAKAVLGVIRDNTEALALLRSEINRDRS